MRTSIWWAMPEGGRETLRRRFSMSRATELKIGGRRFAFWFMALIFALVGGFYFTRFMSVSPSDDSMTQSVKLARNSAFSLAMVLGLCAFIFIHFTAALTVDPVLRDRRIGLLPLVLSSPIGRSTYVMGKFLGGLVLALLRRYSSSPPPPSPSSFPTRRSGSSPPMQSASRSDTSSSTCRSPSSSPVSCSRWRSGPRARSSSTAW